MKVDGKLDKYGRPNESTPSQWKKTYTDFNTPADSDLKVIEAGEDEKPDVGRIDVEMTAPAEFDGEKEDSSDKKKKRKSGETEEERAERKKKKKEKKEKKEKKDRKVEA